MLPFAQDGVAFALKSAECLFRIAENQFVAVFGVLRFCEVYLDL
jgi:hypothetical protein